MLHTFLKCLKILKDIGIIIFLVLQIAKAIMDFKVKGACPSPCVWDILLRFMRLSKQTNCFIS